MLALFVSLALTSCGGNTNNGGGASSSSGAAHVHTFDTTKWESDATSHWHPATCEHTAQKGDKANHTLEDFSDATHVNKAASCKEEGVKYEKCSVCGYIKETKINKLDHAFGEWSVTKEATCLSEGSRERICSACQEKENEVIKALPHSWTVKQEIAATGEGMDYQILECSSCHKLAVCGDFTKSVVNGSSKTVTTADGNFVKLSANDGSYTIKINVDAAYAKTGKMYLRACMGHWVALITPQNLIILVTLKLATSNQKSMVSLLIIPRCKVSHMRI